MHDSIVSWSSRGDTEEIEADLLPLADQGKRPEDPLRKRGSLSQEGYPLLGYLGYLGK
jgi:hypothetical protein